MKFAKVDRAVIGARNYRTCRRQKFIEDFLNSGLMCAEVHWTKEDGYSTVDAVTNALYKAAKYWKAPIAVVRRKDKIYLIRTDMEETTERES